MQGSRLRARGLNRRWTGYRCERKRRAGEVSASGAYRPGQGAIKEGCSMKPSWKVSLALGLLVLALLAGAGSASAWAPSATATIHPGVMTFTGGSSFLGGAGQCTANFVYTDTSGGVYLGQAAHCSSKGSSSETNGCKARSLPLGTAIYSGELVNGVIQKGTKIGMLAYNSWLAMQKARERDANTCAFNDLALIR